MTNPKKANVSSNKNSMYWFHLILTLITWIGPFCISWYLMLPAYILLLLQFLILGKCILNDKHDLNDSEDDNTFYAFLIQQLGFTPNKQKVKTFVRGPLIFLFIIATILWQLVLKMPALLF